MTHILIFIHWFVLAFTFGNVELVTIDNSKSNDFPIEELNNYTLREIFQGGNDVDLNNFDLSHLTIEQMDDWFNIYQENSEREISETYDYIENELTTNDLIYIVLFALLWGLAIKIVKGVM